MAKKKGKNDSSVLILRSKDYEGGVIPPDIPHNAQHVIVIKAKETGKGDKQ